MARYYLDPVGIPTIGIGFTWRSSAFREWWVENRKTRFAPGASMTREEAEEVLIYLFAKEYGPPIDSFLGRVVRQSVFDAMASVVYNCGPGSLKWKWAEAAKKGDYKLAAQLLTTTAVTAEGKKLAGLVRRRKEEANLLENGVYAGGTVSVVSKPLDAMADGILRRKERGPAVAELISNLSELGYYRGAKDDIFGYGTESAVMIFQKANGLKADGIAGPKTLLAIKKALSVHKAAVKPATVMQEQKSDSAESFLMKLIRLLTGGK